MRGGMTWFPPGRLGLGLRGTFGKRRGLPFAASLRFIEFLLQLGQTRFEFRNKAPLFADAPFEIAGMPDAGGDAATLWAATPAGGLATEARAVA